MPLASRPCNLPDGVRFEEISVDSWSPWSICQSRTHRTSTKGKFIKMQDFFHKIQIPGKSAASCIPSLLQIHASEFPLCIFCGPVVAAPLLREKSDKICSLSVNFGPKPHMWTGLSAPIFKRKQLQSKAIPAESNFWRVLTRFARIVMPYSRQKSTKMRKLHHNATKHPLQGIAL